MVDRALAAYTAGWLMGRLGRRFGLSLGFVIATAGAILAVLSIGWLSFAVFVLGALLAGMGRGISELARYAAAEVQNPDKGAGSLSTGVIFAMG
jgi:MFS family permease